MRVTEQIDALRSMAVNPLRYLVAPRFIAGVLMMPLLTIFSTIMGIIGGYMVAVVLLWDGAEHLSRSAPLHIDSLRSLSPA